MYMDHRDNLDDVFNSQTESYMYCHYSSQVYDYVDDVRTPSVILEEPKKPNFKGKEKVAEVDEGCVDAEINEVRRSVRKREPSIQQQADEDSSKNDYESDPNFVDNEYDMEDFVDNEDMFAISEEDEQHLRKAPQSD
ncbi:hypothetical protein Pyn_32386 [Prunus yedoensis var. nudiflora]|uniref:Uncharacterized protein n=1 Tax=Prunus yedoensis var. nudiflora TaxID=2094558 RepID=A0A314UVS1_PRUYE|nr:hypothetical protein Pyn_32386 [Prunus yedoensis var. nudiflora]